MKIRKVTPLGIDYIDPAGNRSFLCFHECQRNWMAHRKRTEQLSEEQMGRFSQTDKTIGQREVCAHHCYIEFFARPFVRFEFRYPEEKLDYERLRDAVWAAGWRTNDLS